MTSGTGPDESTSTTVGDPPPDAERRVRVERDPSLPEEAGFSISASIAEPFVTPEYPAKITLTGENGDSPQTVEFRRLAGPPFWKGTRRSVGGAYSLTRKLYLLDELDDGSWSIDDSWSEAARSRMAVYGPGKVASDTWAVLDFDDGTGPYMPPGEHTFTTDLAIYRGRTDVRFPSDPDETYELSLTLSVEDLSG